MRNKLQLFLFLLALYSGSLKASDSEENIHKAAPKYSLVLGEKSEDQEFFYLTLNLTKADKTEPDVSKLTFSLMKNSIKVIDLQSLYPQSIYLKIPTPALKWFMSKEQSLKLSSKAKYPVKAIVLKIKKSLLKEDVKTYSVEIEEDLGGKLNEKSIQNYPISPR